MAGIPGFRRGRALLPALAATALISLAGSAAAVSFPVSDPYGLDVGYACPTSGDPCSETASFQLEAPAGVTGSITWSGTTPLGTVDIDLWVSSASFVGSFDGVERILFSDVHYTITGWTVYDLSGNLVNTAGGSGTVAGSYEEFDGSSNPVGGPTPFSLPVTFSNLSCPDDGTGLCGFTVGFFGDLLLEVGTTGAAVDHEFVEFIDVTLPIPEPATGSLLALGLAGLALRRRRS